MKSGMTLVEMEMDARGGGAEGILVKIEKPGK